MVISFGEVVMKVKMKMVGSCNRNQQSVWMVNFNLVVKHLKQYRVELM